MEITNLNVIEGLKDEIFLAILALCLNLLMRPSLLREKEVALLKVELCKVFETVLEESRDLLLLYLFLKIVHLRHFCKRQRISCILLELQEEV